MRQSLEKSGKYDQLKTLPPQITGMYEKMTPKEREEAGKQMAGSTMSVSHGTHLSPDGPWAPTLSL